MNHLPAFIQDLGFILIAAALVTLICKRLKQPVVLGYLIAGFLVGPHFSWVPTVSDPESIKVWAEIGVIFLLFGLGLEFSFKKLAQVGKSASITALFEVIFMLGVGYVAGRLLGWDSMESLFLGGVLSISSTTIIVRAFEELGLKGRRFTQLVFGVLVIEDVVAILLLVLLSTVAATQTLSGLDLAFVSLKLFFFMALWFLLGIFILPAFLRKVRDLMNDETTLIVSLGLCLLMVLIATGAGFSPALGAFVMGSLLAETPDGRRIEHLLIPIRDLFAAVFFVSIGMLIDPHTLAEHPGTVLFLVVITIVGKLLSTGFGALLSGQSLKHSVQAGMSLAQIGEFSFIIASLGLSLKVTSDTLSAMAVAVSAITTLTTPFLIRAADPFAAFLEKRLPLNIRNRLEKYSETIAPVSGRKVTRLLWETYGPTILLNSVIVVAITLGISRWATPLWIDRVGSASWSLPLLGLLALTLSAPFLWAVIVSGPRSSQVEPSELARLNKLQFGTSLVRSLWGAVLIGLLVQQFSPVETTPILMTLSLVIFILFFSRHSEPFYRHIERRFIKHLNEKELSDLAQHKDTPRLAPWDATLAEFVLSTHSPLVAKTLAESQIKEKLGVTVALIERGHQKILAPKRSDLLLPYDRIYLVGNDEQLSGAKNLIEMNVPPEQSDSDNSKDTYGLEPLPLGEKSPFIGLNIRECGLRESAHGLIVGIEREGKRWLSPDSSMILQTGDLVWIVGDRQRIADLRRKG